MNCEAVNNIHEEPCRMTQPAKTVAYIIVLG